MPPPRPPALHEHSFALNFAMPVRFRTESLRLPPSAVPSPAVQLPARHGAAQRPLTFGAPGGRLGIPIPPEGSAGPAAGKGGSSGKGRAAAPGSAEPRLAGSAITSRGYRCCARRHLGTNPAGKSRRLARHRQLGLLPSYPAVVSRPDRQEQRP